METKKNNRIASILMAISIIIFIGGFIAGIILATDVLRWSTEFHFWQAFLYWALTFVTGMTFMGFSEIIKLLDDIKNK